MNHHMRRSRRMEDGRGTWSWSRRMNRRNRMRYGRRVYVIERCAAALSAAGTHGIRLMEVWH